MYSGLIIGLMAICSGIVQGITGFGGGIVLMMVLPILFQVPVAAGLSSAICLILCFMMCLQYKEHIDYKKALLPCILCLSVSSFAIEYATYLNEDLLKKMLGVFLFCLSLYYLFFSKGKKDKLGVIGSFLCLTVSSICDGLFGIGGPLMVVYYLSITSSKEEYLGSIQCFFFVKGIYVTFFRILNGILTIDFIPVIICGMIGIVLGLTIANKIVKTIDGNVVRKLTYIMIGFSGIMNILS